MYMKIFFILIFLQGFISQDFEETMEKLETLENYVSQFIEEKKNSKTLIELLTTYMREGSVYNDIFWNILLLSKSDDDLDEYIQQKEKNESKTVRKIRNYATIELPNKEKFDFRHLFATMNGIYLALLSKDYYENLVGWGGDTVTLILDIKNEAGSLEELIDKAKEYLNIKGSFGPEDLISDLDAPILLSLKQNEKKSFAKIIREYYSSKKYTNRIDNFVRLTFPNLSKSNKEDKGKFRNYLFNLFNNDTYIGALEISKATYLYPTHRKAAVYAFADYLWNDLNKDKEEKCDNNHILIEGKCVPKINNCEKYDLNGACKSCYENYFLKNMECF